MHCGDCNRNERKAEQINQENGDYTFLTVISDCNYFLLKLLELPSNSQ